MNQPIRPQPAPVLSRRAFLRAGGASALAVALAACTPSPPPSPTATMLPSLTPSPLPPATSTPQPTATFSPDQLPGLVSAEEAAFLASHEVLRGDTSRPVMLMTYDDVAKLVDVEKILAGYKQVPGALATFFWIGESIEPSSKVVRRIAEEGHCIGLHGWAHIPLTPRKNDAVRRDLERSIRALNNVLPGYRPRFIRFPYGDGVNDPRLLAVAAEFGLQHVYWSTGSGGVARTTKDLVLSKAGNGQIVLSHMHRKYDVEQAGDIVRGLTDLGYSLETLETGRAPADIYRAG